MEVRIIHTKINCAAIKTTLIDVGSVEATFDYEKGIYGLHLVCDFGPIGRQIDEEQNEWGGTGNYDETGWSFCGNQDIYFSSSTPIKVKIEEVREDDDDD